MKPHPRIRKTIKWGGAALTVLLAAVWIWSGWGFVRFPLRGDLATVGGSVSLSLGSGRFTRTTLGIVQYPGWAGLAFDGFRYETNSGSAVTLISVPLWAPGMLSLCVTAIAWRLDTLASRRALLNLCPNCHYDRTDLAPGAACPECGAKPVPAPLH
jgi:hypothetical protein